MTARRGGHLARSATSTAGLILGVTFGALRDFVWADLRGGTISLRGVPAPTRGVVYAGFGLLALVLGMLVYGDVLRARLPMTALPSSVPGRGSLVPVALVPATLFLVAVSWSFVLAGALHAHPLLRIAVVALYVAMAFSWTGQAITGGLTLLAVAWGALLAVPIMFAVRWRRPARPLPELIVLLGLTSATFATLQAEGAVSWRATGVALLIGHIGSEILSMTLLILPLLSFVGMGIAGFVRQAAGWTVEIASERLPHQVVRGLLGIVFGWRLYEIVGEAIERSGATSPEQAVAAYATALSGPVAVAVAWVLVRRARPRALRPRPAPAHVSGASASRADAGSPRGEPDRVAEAAERYALPLIVTYSGLQLFGFLILVFGLPLATVGLAPASLMFDVIGPLVELLNEQAVTVGWRLCVAGAAVGLGIVLARRGNRSAALYLATFGPLAAISELTAPGLPFGVLVGYGGGASLFDFWWVILVGVLGAAWFARGRLTDARVASLLMILLMTALLRQTDFISNRFSPFFGSGGVAFLVFGLAWDALTIGAWANQSTPALPRASRIMLYLGYTLLSVAVVNWAAAVHDLAALARLTGEAGLTGLQVYGRPMLYAVFALLLAAPESAEDGR